MPRGRHRLYSDDERRERKNTAQARYRLSNLENIKAKNRKHMRAKYIAQPEVQKEKSRQWLLANPGRAYELTKSWRARNYDKAKKFSLRQARAKKEATPKWLSKFQRSAFSFFSAKAKFLTNQTGVLHVVDHVIPLQGENVRGLHVPWNLQVITMVENSRKSNKVG